VAIVPDHCELQDRSEVSLDNGKERHANNPGACPHLWVPEDYSCSFGRLLLYAELQELVHGRLQRLQLLRVHSVRWNEDAHLLAVDAGRRHWQLREARGEPKACLLPIDAVLLCIE
jgi:hypothetical protein